MYPCDENEQDRLDLFHRVLCVARREILHSPNIKIPSSIPRGLSSIHDQGPRILDLGCGTGTEISSSSFPSPVFLAFSFYFLPPSPGLRICTRLVHKFLGSIYLPVSLILHNPILFS